MFDHIIQYAIDSWGLLPLLALVFIAGLGVIIERLVFFHSRIRAGETLADDLALVAAGDKHAAEQVQAHYGHTVQGQLVKAALQQAGATESKMARQIEESIMFQMPKMDRYLWVLDTCVTLGPLLGLLGTIVHLIQAFAVLSASPEHHVASITGPIAHALVATAGGLMVAILCVVFLNYFNKRIRLTVNQMDLIKSMMVGRFATPQN